MVVVVIAACAVLGVGGAGALCKFELNCHTGAGINDAKLLRHLQETSKGSPPGKLPPGFRERIVARGFHLPTDFAFLPDGAFLVSEKDGLVLRVDSAGRRRAVLDLRRRVATYDYRGVITVAVPPTFARDRRFDVLYVVKRAGAPDATTVARFSSFRLGVGARRAGDEKVLVGAVTVPTCSALPATADCLPSDLDHDGAEAAFASDGTIFVATGDGGGYDNRVEPTSLRAQNVDSLAGKVLHITQSGAGVPTNPWWNGDARANRSKVWAVGFRNPFRLSLTPGTDVPVVGDVGRHGAEELDIVLRGANYGWPCFEGFDRAVEYRRTPLCRALYRRPVSTVQEPVVALSHGVSNSIVAGAFAPAGFPPPYRGTFLFADWVRGWIRYVDLRGTAASPTSHPFAAKLPGPVALHVSPTGALYYLALNAGDLRRIDAR